MPEYVIRFSCDFTKLHGQRSAVLLSAKPYYYMPGVMHKDTIKYDTDDLYQLACGEYIQLVFIGDKDIPFTTYRKFNIENWELYSKSIGFEFDIEVED